MCLLSDKFCYLDCQSTDDLTCVGANDHRRNRLNKQVTWQTGCFWFVISGRCVAHYSKRNHHTPVWGRSGAYLFAARECKLMHVCVRARWGSVFKIPMHKLFLKCFSYLKQYLSLFPARMFLNFGSSWFHHQSTFKWKLRIYSQLTNNLNLEGCTFSLLLREAQLLYGHAP